MIILGILIGLFIGGCLGVIVMALMNMAKEADRHYGMKEKEDRK